MQVVPGAPDVWHGEKYFAWRSRTIARARFTFADSGAVQCRNRIPKLSTVSVSAVSKAECPFAGFNTTEQSRKHTPRYRNMVCCEAIRCEQIFDALAYREPTFSCTDDQHIAGTAGIRRLRPEPPTYKARKRRAIGKR